jgi:hypothetical protein
MEKLNNNDSKDKLTYELLYTGDKTITLLLNDLLEEIEYNKIILKLTSVLFGDTIPLVNSKIIENTLFITYTDKVTFTNNYENFIELINKIIIIFDFVDLNQSKRLIQKLQNTNEQYILSDKKRPPPIVKPIKKIDIILIILIIILIIIILIIILIIIYKFKKIYRFKKNKKIN